MKVLTQLPDLENLRAPPSILGVIQNELNTLAELSGGQRIDLALGKVFYVEPGDDDSVIQEHFGKPFTSLGFDGVVRRQQSYVCYLLRDNECVFALIIGDEGLTDDWKTKLQSELTGGA